MKTQHTPGPWGCIYTSNHAHNYRITRADKTPLPLTVIANDHSEQRANARLIAAAPELLEALKEAEGVMRLLWGCFLAKDYYRWGEDDADALAKARVAIAKATEGN